MISATESRSGSHSLRPSYLFADFRLDTERGILTKEGHEIPLRPKSFEVLSYLVGNPGRLVSKDELLRAVWPEVIVTDDSLTQCVVDIRKALDDRARRLVRTAPRRGYLLDTEVTRCATETAIEEPAPGVRLHRRPALAALAFLAVAAVSAWLLQAGTAGRADPSAGNEPSGAPGQAVAATVAPPTSGSQQDLAQEHYLKARFFLDRRSRGDVVRAHENVQSAIDLDPGRADYWVGLASTTGLLALGGDIAWQDALAARKQALDRALTLDPLNAEAYARLARLQTQTGHPELARAYLERALELGPDNELVQSIAAGIAFREQRFDDAIALQRRVVELDPIGFVQRGTLANYLFLAGYLDEAAEEFVHASELNPSHAAPFTLQLIKIRILQQRFDEAERLAMTIPAGNMHEQGLAYVHHARGREDEAEAALENFLRNHRSYHAPQLTDLYAYLGQPDESFRWLGMATEMAFDRGGAPANRDMLVALRRSPFLQTLHEDPRWTRWLQETRHRIEDARGLTESRHEAHGDLG